MPEPSPLATVLLAQDAPSNAAIYSFAVYLVGVVLLAWFSNRLLRSKSFLSEYFLGSRSLGVWAFALTFAATSSSGGSFVGFPALIYTHGWILALWIGSYMVVPILAMGLLGKRLNQVARKSGAITIPDVLRARFNSPALGFLSTGVLVFFMAFNLIAQFTGGSVILQTLLSDVPMYVQASGWTKRLLVDLPFVGPSVDGGHVLCLLVFGVAVVAYTTYGGFRAVVWTDVMQGFVMVGGVVIMLPIAIWLVGGLSRATETLSEMTPPRFVTVELSSVSPTEQAIDIRSHSVFFLDGPDGEQRLLRLARGARIRAGDTRASFLKDDRLHYQIPAVETMIPAGQRVRANRFPIEIIVGQVRPTDKRYLRGEGQEGVYVTGPGPSTSSAAGFLPVNLAISFFFMWTFSGAGQPGNMVRLMAFKDSRTLRRAIFTVAIYYSMIYFPLVIIFTCARVLLPGWETLPDRIMPEMTKALSLAIDMPWLGGLLVAAPFAAVMSTMDSFLLMISSALVRDIYQRGINPKASEKTLKRLTYVVTAVVGVGAMLAAVSPPKFLQSIIVFTGSGLSTSFLVPIGLGLYWPRFNRSGAVAGMLGGFISYTLLYAVGFAQSYQAGVELTPLEPGGFHPFLVGCLVSLVCAIVATLSTAPPPRHLLRKYFLVQQDIK